MGSLRDVRVTQPWRRSCSARGPLISVGTVPVPTIGGIGAACSARTAAITASNTKTAASLQKKLILILINNDLNHRWHA